jgi:2-polyprenyl-3-methyl-5-hydroxy-6-metoxy-1,4-benzoquinol methylase
MSMQREIKEEDIRPEDLFSEFIRLSIDDAKHFFNRAEFEHIACPGCGADSPTAESFTKHSFHYAHCGACGSLCVNERPNKAELLRYYAASRSQAYWANTILARTDESRKKSILLPALARVEELVQNYNLTPKSIVDVGAANGAFLSEWKKNHPGMDIIGIEPGQDAAENCRRSGARVYEGFVEDPQIRAHVRGDLITCFEVLEHVHSPPAFVQSLADITAPGGSCLISCLGVDGFDIQVLWQNSRAITPPFHLNFLSRDALRSLFEKAGFTRVHILTPGRLDVEIIRRSQERGQEVQLSRFEKLLMSREKETQDAFQAFLAQNALSSHVWVLAQK